MTDTKTVLTVKDEARLDVLKDAEGKLLLTDSQKKAVLERGHILVSASAGSGKTATMIKRILLLVAEGASLRDMLILVYNNAAADELKQRLHQELFAKACASSGALREHFAQELDDLPFCHVCTIHAYCQSLIRENFEKLGISPAFEVLDENAHAVYVNKALDEVFSSYASANDEVFCELVDVFSQARKDDNFKSNVKRLYGLMEIQPDADDFKQCVEECYCDFEHSKFQDVLTNYYRTVASRAVGIFEELYNDAKDVPKLSKRVEHLLTALFTAKGILQSKTLFEMCKCALPVNGIKFSNPGKVYDAERIMGESIKEYVNQFKSAIEDLIKVYDNYENMKAYHPQNAKFVRKLVEIVEKFSDVLQKNKRKDNVLSFEDLQRYAMQLLSHDEYGLGGEYIAVFVDEYQDVNPTQEAIIQKLIKDECFIVGDVKQSIYGFRLADPTIFLSRQAKYKSLDGDGTNIDFNRNFRSAYSILKFVNDVFDCAMTKTSADVDYKNEARFELCDVAPVNLEGVSAEGSVSVHLFVKPKSMSGTVGGLYDITAPFEAEYDAQSAKSEGMFIANEIKSLVGRAVGIDADGNGKHIGYGDIAVLFRSRSQSAQTILDVLYNEGIPINDGAFSKTKSAPERELILMLQAIDNPRQDIGFAGYLLSYLGGYDESELARIASIDAPTFYDKFLGYTQNADGLSAKIKRTLATLDGYRLKASFESVGELMNGIIADFCYDAYLMRKGEADVYALKSFISSVCSQNYSLGEFLQNYGESATSVTSAGGGDRVTVSTFHAYKGLEKPIVFVADSSYGFNFKAANGDLISSGKGIGATQNDSKGLIGINAFDFENKTKDALTLSKLAVSKCIRQNQIKEEIRLFYVALTRAKQMMYITATVSDSASQNFGVVPQLKDVNCDLDFISMALYENSTAVNVYRHNTTSQSNVDLPANRMILPKPDVALTNAIEKLQSQKYAYAQSTQLAMKYSVSALDGADEQTVYAYGDSANIGTAYHKVMQHIDYFAEGIDGVRAELDRMVCEDVLTREEYERINPEDIRRCLASDLMELARKAERKRSCFREQPFMMYRPANEVSDDFDVCDKVLVQGVVDLFINDDEKIIVDFKNSRLSDKKSLKRYKKQLYLYKMALESIYSVKIDKVLLYSFKTGATVEL